MLDPQEINQTQILDKILEEVAKPLPLDIVLGNCLDILLKLEQLSLLPKAGIFLAESTKTGEQILRLVAERNLDQQIKTLCSKVEFGCCLCGRAAQSQKSIHASFNF